MKKRFSVAMAVVLSISIIVSCFTIPVIISTNKEPLPLASYEEVKQYCDEVKSMSMDEDAVNSRLLVMANKKIDYKGAVQVAECSDGSYVLQYESREQAEEAFNYYEGKSYVLAVCFDNIVDIELTSSDPADFSSNTYSATNSNIDDAYKLLAENNIELPEIKVGILDTGVALNDITTPRFLGGYSYLDGYASNGTQVPDTAKGYHGTSSAGTVIRNTLDNVKIYSYQVSGGDGTGVGYSDLSSAIKLAGSQGCDVLNASFILSYSATDSTFKSCLNYTNNTVKQVTNAGCHIVCSAGNDNKNLSDMYYLPQRCDNVIVSGANDVNNVRASFSNYGTLVDIYTLGNRVSSCNVDGSLSEGYSGTSASSPVLASICTILLTVNPDITNDEIVTLLRDTGYGFDEEESKLSYYIIADAYEAVKSMLSSKGLSKAQFSYEITKDELTNDAVLTINASDDTEICYRENSTSSIYIKPYIDKYIEPLHFSEGGLVSVCAYSPNKEKNYKLIRIPDYNQADYSVTEAVKSYEVNALNYYNTTEKCVTIPEYIDGVQIQEIGAYCFTGNENIEKVILPPSVTTIDEYAFASCPKLKAVVASGATTCKRYCFSNSTSLARLSLPQMKNGNTGLFENCVNLKLLESSSMFMDYHRCYYNCSSLKLLYAMTAYDFSKISINKNAVMGTSLTLLTIGTVSNADAAGVKVLKNLDKHTCEYMCEDNYDGTFSYYCVWCWKEQQLGKDDLLAIWDVKYINKKPSYYSDGYLLDVNEDNIINAKDFAIINKM